MPGPAQSRMLDLFGQLADEVTEVSTEPAEEILLDAFRKVQEEILAVLKKHPDPLDAARDAIVKAHETYVTQERRPASASGAGRGRGGPRRAARAVARRR